MSLGWATAQAPEVEPARCPCREEMMHAPPKVADVRILPLTRPVVHRRHRELRFRGVSEARGAHRL